MRRATSGRSTRTTATPCSARARARRADAATSSRWRSGLTRALELVAPDLINQYTVVYESASEPGASRKLSVSAKRRGVTLRAPARIPG